MASTLVLQDTVPFDASDLNGTAAPTERYYHMLVWFSASAYDGVATPEISPDDGDTWFNLVWSTLDNLDSIRNNTDTFDDIYIAEIPSDCLFRVRMSGGSAGSLSVSAQGSQNQGHKAANSLPFDIWFKSLIDLASWILQEPDGTVALATNSALATGRNWLLNPGFEVDNSNWAASGAATITRSVAQAHSGSASGLATIANVNEFITPDAIDIAGGRTYIITAWVYLDGAGEVQINQFSGANMTVDVVVSTTLTGQWVQLQTTAVGHKNISAIPFIIRQISGTNNFFVDDVSLKQTGILEDGAYPGSEELTNGDFATGDFTGWTVVESPPNRVVSIIGNQCVMVNDGTGTSNISQIALEVGLRYKIVTDIAAISSGSVNVGTTLESVATYSTPGIKKVEFVVTLASTIFALGASAGANATINSISITEVNPLTADHDGVAVGQPGQGNITVMAEYDGIMSETNKTRSELNSMTNPLSTGIGEFVQKDTWDANERDFVSFTVDADNWMRIGNTTTPGEIYYQYRENGVTREVLYATGSPSGVFYPYMIVDNDAGFMYAVYNGAQVGSVALTGDFVGNFASIFIGSRGGTNYHLGKLAYDATDLAAPSVSDITDRYNRSGI